MAQRKRFSEYLIIALFSLVAMIGVGVGMYYLGLEKGRTEGECPVNNAVTPPVDNPVQDPDPNPANPSQIEDPPSGWYAYQNVDLQIRFYYPDGWVVTEKRGKDTEFTTNIKEVYATAPSGTKFVYYSADIVGIGVEGSCDPTNPTGDGELLYSCVFVDEAGAAFARYRPNENSVERGEWLVAEESSDGQYVSWPSSSFTYFVKNSAELETLDQIMGSVQRL